MDSQEIIREVLTACVCPGEELHSLQLLEDILAVLEDGEALLALGVKDQDKEAVEEAHAEITKRINFRSLFMSLHGFDISKPLKNVNGLLIDSKNYNPGGNGYYPSIKVFVETDGYHPYVIWNAVDASKDGADPYFFGGKYFKDYWEAKAEFENHA